MSLLRRDVGEVEALITDRYLDNLLSVQPGAAASPIGDPGAGLGAAVRAVSRRLAADLPRFHPSFRFEERLALRLAEMAVMRMPIVVGGDAQVMAIRRIQPSGPDPLGVAGDGLGTGAGQGAGDDRADNRPLLIGGAVAASALSLAGAWLAWRRRTSPMARAIRAAHHLRQTGA